MRINELFNGGKTVSFCAVGWFMQEVESYLKKYDINPTESNRGGNMD